MYGYGLEQSDRLFFPAAAPHTHTHAAHAHAAFWAHCTGNTPPSSEVLGLMRKHRTKAGVELQARESLRISRPAPWEKVAQRNSGQGVGLFGEPQSNTSMSMYAGNAGNTANAGNVFE